MKPIRLIVGLANPGDEYSATRHNAGAWFVETLAKAHNEILRPDKKLHGFSGRIVLADHECRLLIPTTYMNNSGTAVNAAAKYYDISPDEILIVHDELDLEPGDARLKFSGGHGGHNGLRDIFEFIEKDFHRLRIGIGKPPHKGVDHVLGKPSKAEREAIDTAIENALAVMPDVLTGNIEKATKELNTGS